MGFFDFVEEENALPVFGFRDFRTLFQPLSKRHPMEESMRTNELRATYDRQSVTFLC
jgi:hypothetical protein